MSLPFFNLTELIHEELRRQRRPHDDLLHASSHFVGSLRHVQLEVAGAPMIERPFVQEIPLFIGDALHELIHRAMRGLPAMTEVDVTPWMPTGWGGTADAVIWQPEQRTFRLRDYKSQKGESWFYLKRDGVKDEHRAQVSLYWHALAAMGLNMDPDIDVYYLPKNEPRPGQSIEPEMIAFKALPKRALHAEAAYRLQRVAEYRESLGEFNDAEFLEPWVTSALEPVQEREQRIYFDRATETWDVKLVPHWSTSYCPFPNELCDCSEQGTTKIGMFDVDGTTYIPRKGYKDIEPTEFPA